MNVSNIAHLTTVKEKELIAEALHPAWKAFVQYCAELKHGEIEILKIQDGIPVLAELTRQKVKFTT